jgi:hypothetical protein
MKGGREVYKESGREEGRKEGRKAYTLCRKEGSESRKGINERYQGRVSRKGVYI